MIIRKFLDLYGEGFSIGVCLNTNKYATIILLKEMGKPSKINLRIRRTK